MMGSYGSDINISDDRVALQELARGRGAQCRATFGAISSVTYCHPDEQTLAHCYRVFLVRTSDSSQVWGPQAIR